MTTTTKSAIMKLKVNLDAETVAALPLRTAIMVDAHTLLRNVVAQMRAQKLGCAIVVDDDSRPIGMFSERALIQLLAEGIDLDAAVVGSHLDGDFAQLRSGEPIRQLFREIYERGHRFICVVDDEGRVVGLTGQRGLSEYISEHYPQQVMVQHLGGTQVQKCREGA